MSQYDVLDEFHGIFTGKRHGNYFINGDHYEIIDYFERLLKKYHNQINLKDFEQHKIAKIKSSGTITFSDEELRALKKFSTTRDNGFRINQNYLFEDFAIQYLGFTKIRTAVCRYIVTSDPTPHITFEDFILSVSHCNVHQVPQMIFGPDGLFHEQEPTILQKNADLNKRQEIEQFKMGLFLEVGS